jgi:hypothetical protein
MGPTEGAGAAGVAEVSGSNSGVGVGLGIARLCAMKLMKFPSGDHVTVS